ncbi:MAG: Quinolinate phosphoribosyltransferase [decarboxylating] [uncultured Nocardioidaceae bacterium]|uniref:Nicotinate-nucleotide pyrophosphorylase [carboxylating] n=1 Tax=uncultured Nocardioidaceae bacterium TaxID=253824 RepID=A0A6J4LPE6_9ACTN|nr:MAG: Quinolinate phosphoribosyltransferase [decarboxylating] [uncultured Nocardioidaceae bacterium]
MTGPVRLAFDLLPTSLTTELAGCGIDPRAAYDHVARSVAEDVPGEDVTSSATVPTGDRATADLVARADGVLAGRAVAELVLHYVVGSALVLEPHVADGDRVRRGDLVLTAHGPTGLLLTAERTALNYLGHLSGIATTTAAWVEAVAGTGARVRDTRKTVPGMRQLAKYAVRCGGGTNHRSSLSDQALVKDNHVLAAGGVVPAYRAVRERHPELPVQVEVTTLDQLRELLDAGADQVLLDNMGTEQLAGAVRLTAGRAVLEASGGLTVERALEVARTGVDLLAVGALTHSAVVLDIAMDLRPAA